MKPNLANRVGRSAFSPRFSRFILAVAGLAALWLAGCVQHSGDRLVSSAPVHGRLYLVHFTVARLQDHSSLASVTVPVRLSQGGVVKTDSRMPLGNRPALPVFSASLTATGTRGLYQLVTKVAVREVSRNKKGKLKTSKRNEGALLPIRLDEPQTASPDGDPVQISVRVEAR